MASLSTIQLSQYAAAIIFIIDVIQEVQGFIDPAYIDNFDWKQVILRRWKQFHPNDVVLDFHEEI